MYKKPDFMGAGKPMQRRHHRQDLSDEQK